MTPHGGQHVVFDFEGSLELARRLWSLAGSVEAAQASRDTAATTALTDWLGRFAEDFRTSMTSERTSTTNVAGAMRSDALTLARLWREAMFQEAKVRYADHVTRKRNERSTLDRIGDYFTGEDDYGPEPTEPATPLSPGFAPTATLPVYD